MSHKRQAVIPAETVGALLSVAGDDILVGGQALAFWVQRFGVTVPDAIPAITADVDFLTSSAANRARVNAFSQVLAGTTHFPNERAMTALVGQAYRDLGDDVILNVDVLFTVFGLDAQKVRERAVRITAGDAKFLVMHPMHVLRSRLANLYKLQEKQDDKGAQQLCMAIDVAREHLRAVAAEAAAPGDIAAGRSPIQALVTEIERMAVEDAGRKVAARFGVHVADAIDPSLIPAGPFWTKRWPALSALMSPGYAAGFNEPLPDDDDEEAAPGDYPRPRP